MNEKVFDLISRVHETRFIVQNVSCLIQSKNEVIINVAVSAKN